MKTCRIRPDKHRYLTKVQAEHRLAEIQMAAALRDDPDEVVPVAVYLCPCSRDMDQQDHWLLTHRPQMSQHVVAMARVARASR